ncbi:MAG: hypothetical protein IPO50_10640 [Sphingomonadales bacterium]|nr:hypothetical protein [Sphingomonadales bacterium]
MARAWFSRGRSGPRYFAKRLIEPKPGRLVMFPSTMWHGTVPFDAGERLTVAFDVPRQCPAIEQLAGALAKAHRHKFLHFASGARQSKV